MQRGDSGTTFRTSVIAICESQPWEKFKGKRAAREGGERAGGLARPGNAGSERGAWRTGGSHGRPGGRRRRPAGRRGVQAARRGACRAPGRGTLRRARDRRGVWSGRAARSPAGRHQGRWAAGTRPTRDARSDTTPTEPSARGGDRVRRTRTERGDPGKALRREGDGVEPAPEADRGDSR